MLKQTGKPATEGANAIWFLVELAIYALFVLGYYFAVLHFCRDWLKQLFDRDKLLYAFVALGLIIGQAVALELVTAGLYKLTRRQAKG
ncbi:MAG: hypothetical protein ABSH48_09195 [Verrucomicrobiota bacterium]